MHVLITGGTGSLGQTLIPAFLESGHIVTILSRDPHHQAALRSVYPQIRYSLADVCDRSAVLRACEGQDWLVHAAALKRVEIGELAPEEYLRVNTLGTQVVASAARQAGINRCLFISTDKCVEAVNLYGKTKALAEHLWLNAHTQRSNFSVIRYGNLINSAGSVWDVWRAILAQGGALPVRRPEPTRFCFFLDEAIGFVVNALKAMEYHRGIFIPETLRAISLWDLARTLQPQDQWVFEPLGQGEKQHEILLAKSESLAIGGIPPEHLWKVLPTLTNGFRPLWTSSDAAPRIQVEEVRERLEAYERTKVHGNHR